MTPERLAELEEERRFLLASIRDIEREREAGDVDGHDFTVLRDGYVARAAAVLRELEDGRSRQLPRRVVPLWRRIAVIVVTLTVAVGIGVFVARSSGQRLPGQSLTGGQEIDEVTRALAEASRMLAVEDFAGALQRYDQVLAIEPQNAEALTYRAWLTLLGADGARDDALARQAVDELAAVVALDDTYADAHCLLAVAAARFVQPPDAGLAASEGQACLAADPPGMLRGMVEQLLAGVLPAIDSTTPSTTG